MSPAAFRQQVTQLLSELTRCHELCNAIRTNRRLGSTHEALDRLQSGLKSSASTVQIEFNTLRKVIGSRMELGDDISRNSLNRSIRELQSEIEPKLNDIAYPRRDRHDPEHPRFLELLRRWQRIEANVTVTLEALAERLEKSAVKPDTQKPAQEPKEPQKPVHKADEVVISLKELEKLLDHKKNCWYETIVAGKVLYVNCFDDKKSQWEKPDGYIRALPKPKKPTRAPTWDQEPRRPARDGFWNDPRGW